MCDFDQRKSGRNGTEIQGDFLGSRRKDSAIVERRHLSPYDLATASFYRYAKNHPKFEKLKKANQQALRKLGVKNQFQKSFEFSTESHLIVKSPIYDRRERNLLDSRPATDYDQLLSEK